MADVFRMFFDCFKSVFSTLESSYLISIAGVDVTLMDVLWGFFLLSAIFTFALVPRAGSGLGGVGNVLTFMRDDFNRENREQRRKESELRRQNESFARFKAREDDKEWRNSYEHYASNRQRNYEYFKRYNKEHGIKYKKGDK